MKSEKVNEILNEYVKKGKIDSFGFGSYDCWNNIPYIEISGKTIFLCKTSVAFNALTIFTIYDYQSISSVKKMLNTIIEYKEILNSIQVNSYKDLENIVSYIKLYQKEDKLSKDEAIKATIKCLVS